MNADLVVLSACETALGREIRGEGFVGLTQGFFLAGARQVMASLWRVPDQGTAILMESLYRRLIRFDEPPSTALRHAQLELVGERRWADPYYWAGFVLQAARAGS
jgi:CHAT domain-containing protein